MSVTPTVPRALKPILVILGGVREIPLGDAKTDGRRYTTERQAREGGELVAETRMKGTIRRKYPDEWRAAHRLCKNANEALKSISYSTPLGRMTIAEKKTELLHFRDEVAKPEAAAHNRECRHWQVVVELHPQELDENGCSELLTIMGGDLPSFFFVQEEIKA